MAKSNLTAGMVKARYMYEPATGRMFSKKDGREVGHFDSRNRYRIVNIGGSRYAVHRLAWLMSYGRWPEGQIDHINQDKTDNRLSNLRVVSQSVNLHNRSAPNKNNSSGVLGINRAGSKWVAQITVNNRNVRLGAFDTPEMAKYAYDHAKRFVNPKQAAE